uniref:Uncharacterized protein n=1 Tax=Oryza brachyantha TaxID=4533 RepID=J3M884_ORYBR
MGLKSLAPSKHPGETYLYWLRRRPALYVTDPELIGEIGRCVSLDMGKPKYLQKGQEPLFGGGVLKANGACWARQRRVIAPEFYMARVRSMVQIMVDAAQPLVATWEARVDGAATAGRRACFGSDYSRGREIFLRLRELSGLMSETSVIFSIPSLRHLPTVKNRRIWRLTGEIRSLIMELVRERRDAAAAAREHGGKTPPERDFLGSIIENSGEQPRPDDFVVDNCKNIYFAGHETSAVTATWCLMLLAAHPEWQDRARAEVLENLALVEVKTLVAVVLARFAFTLSPEYIHSPAFRLIIEPEFGLRLRIRRAATTQPRTPAAPNA